MHLDEWSADGHAGITLSDQVAGLSLDFDNAPAFILPFSLFRAAAEAEEFDLYQGAEACALWQAPDDEELPPMTATLSIVPNQPVVILLRQRDLTAAYITQASLASITYAVFDTSGEDPETATDTGTLTIVSTVFDRPKIDNRWTNDSIGYNFLHVLDAFPDAGHFYSVYYQFIPTSGADARFARIVPVKTANFHGTLP